MDTAQMEESSVEVRSRAVVALRSMAAETREANDEIADIR